LLARLGVHHLVQRGLHARMESLWQFVEDVAEFVTPIALLARLRPHVPHGDPEAEGAIAHDNYGWAHTSALQIAENGLPAFGALAVAVLDRDQLLGPVRPHADHHERAEPVVI